MTTPNLYFYAFCPSTETAAAFKAAAFALSGPATSRRDEVAPVAMPADPAWPFPADTVFEAHRVHLSSGRSVYIDLCAYSAAYVARSSSAPLDLSPRDSRTFLSGSASLPAGDRGRTAEAAAAWLYDEADLFELLLSLAAPSGRGPVSSAAYSPAYRQGPPTAGGATYHARAAGIWRDLATSFLHLLDGQTVERFSAMSDDALCAAVDATRPDAAVKVGKEALLTREQVLATINVPSAALLDALEASGGEDAEWRAVEESARELLAAARSGSPLVDVNVATRHHARFLAEHAPLRVHRRADGSVVLATHPHSQLWPLYEGALDLLGLRPLP